LSSFRITLLPYCPWRAAAPDSWIIYSKRASPSARSRYSEHIIRTESCSFAVGNIYPIYIHCALFPYGRWRNRSFGFVYRYSNSNHIDCTGSCFSYSKRVAPATRSFDCPRDSNPVFIVSNIMLGEPCRCSFDAALHTGHSGSIHSISGFVFVVDGIIVSDRQLCYIRDVRTTPFVRKLACPRNGAPVPCRSWQNYR